MKHILSFLFASLLTLTTLGQTWTSKNVSMTGTSAGFWEYLPSNYSDPGNASLKYPTIIFFHGSGANGNSYSQINNLLVEGLPKVINDGVFPSTFTVNGTTHKFIVICPQVSWSGTNQNLIDIVTYVKANYKVDPTRLYLTGLSQGGGMSMSYVSESASQAQNIAAVSSAAGSLYPTTPRAQIVGDNDLPSWFYHNNGDPTINVGYTNTWVTEINNFVPTPLAQKTILTSNTHDSWTAMYDPATDVTGTYNIYEWMLQYSRPANAPTTTYKIAVLGSSTAFGTGASPVDSSWVKRLEAFYQKNLTDNADTLVYNLGVNGTSTYNAMPTGSTPPGGRPSPDATKNITYAMTNYSPNLVILNFPSNDVGFGYTDVETMNNYRTIGAAAVAGGSNYYVLTTQPRDDYNSTQKNQLISQRDSILLGFPGKAINIFDTLASVDDLSINPTVAFGDNVHVNNIGHRYIFSKIIAGPVGETGGGTAASYIIPVQASNIIDLNGTSSKSAKRLFDGNLTTRIDNNSVVDFRAGGSYPFNSFVVLDSVYNLSDIDYKVLTTNATTLSLKFYGLNKAQIGDSVILDISGYDTWKNAVSARTGVRFVQVNAYNTGAVSDGLTEIRLKGYTTAVAPSIYPTGVPITAVTDLGYYANGINTIGDRLNKVDALGDTITLKVAKAARWYWEGSVFDKYPETYNNRLINGPLFLGRYGDNHSGNLLNQWKRWDIKAMMAKTGGSIKWLDTTTANQNGIWLGGTIANQKRYTETTANPEIDTSYNGIAEQMRRLIALYGSNASADLTGVTILNGSSVKGQNQMEIFETGNEESRWWQQDYYHTPKAWYEMQKAIYTAGKTADPNAKIYGAALPGIDTTFWKAVFFYHYWSGGDVNNFPADGFNFNHYINNIKGEQQGAGDTWGISPEKWQTIQEITSLKSFFNRVFPNKRVQWTEFAYATDDQSPYDVNPIGAKSDRQVQADWTIRLKAVVQTQKFIERMYYYAFFEDFTGPFNSMALVHDNFDAGSVYLNSTVFPIGYALGQELYAERNYKFFSDIIQNGDSTGVWVTRKDHLTDPNKKLYKIWYGTDNNTTANYTLTVSGATAAKRYNLNYTKYVPDSATVTISTNQMFIPASEAMTWVEVTTTGGGNVTPSVSAGSDQAITLPNSQVLLSGTASDPDGTIAQYAWSRVSGPSTVFWTNQTSASATASSLVAGTYVFRLTVTDNSGATASDDIIVTVTPANVFPVVNAGVNQAITLPTSQVSLNGAASDADGTIVSIGWTVVQGTGVVFSTPTVLTTNVTGLAQGVYVFRLSVTDNRGAISYDDIQVTVNAAVGDVIYVTDVKRYFGFLPFKLNVVLTYQDGTRQTINNRNSYALTKIWLRSEVIGGVARTTAWLRFADNYLLIIRKKGDY